MGLHLGICGVRVLRASGVVYMQVWNTAAEGVPPQKGSFSHAHALAALG